VVLGGGILGAGADAAAPAVSPVTDAVAASLTGARLIPVPDGVVGAAVLALAAAGVPADAAVRDRIRRGVAERQPIGSGPRA
jgi:hypothetical protein